MFAKLVLIFIAVGPLIASQESVTLKISKNNAERGDDVQFTCISQIRTSSFTLLQNEIELMGVNIIGPTKLVVNSYVQPNVVDRFLKPQTIIFRINSIQANFAGVYSCGVINVDGTKNAVHSSKIELYVGYSPSNMKIDYELYETLLVIKCSYFDGKPSATFEMLIGNHLQKQLLNVSTATQLVYSKHVQLSEVHKKQVTCIAKNRYNPSQASKTIDMAFGLLMEYIYCNGQASTNISVSRSTEVLECSAFAHPPAQAFWTRIQGSSLQFSLRDEVRQLNLNQFKLVNSAFQATCRVTNEVFPAGIDKTFHITFFENNSSPSSRVTIKEGSFFHFISSEWSNYIVLTLFGLLLGIFGSCLAIQIYKRVQCQCCCTLQSSPKTIKNKTDGTKIYNMETFDITYEDVGDPQNNRQFSISGPDGYMYPIDSNPTNKYGTTF